MPVFNRQSLMKSLRLIAPVVPDRTPESVLKYVRILAMNGTAVLSATDNVVYASSYAECDGLDIECLVPADRLMSLLTASTSDEVTLTSVQGGVMLEDKTGKYNMLTPDVAEFPARGKPVEPTLQTDSIYLSRTLPLVLSCIEERGSGGAYYIEGVRFHSADGKVRLVGTDLNRLCICDLGPGELKESFTVQPRVASMVLKIECVARPVHQWGINELREFLEGNALALDEDYSCIADDMRMVAANLEKIVADNSIHEQIETLKDEIKDLESEADGKDAEISGLESDMADLEGDISDLQERISDLEEQISELENNGA